MQYFITFLEGLITFISPCVLPLLPTYIFYFAGRRTQGGRIETFANALAFVLGFTIIFTAMGAFSGVVGRLLIQYQTWINVVSGSIVILFGLHYIGVFKIKFLERTWKPQKEQNGKGLLASLLLGIVFAIGWSPCTGVFLGSAVLLAAQQGGLGTGTLLLLCYSLGLGIPFILSALLIDSLKSAFDWIKKQYRLMQLLSGILLLIIGVLMLTGLFSKMAAALSRGGL
ncbi:MAG: cytochrome c biogenesis CcdA family protein [Lachnospiraceae bacterium]